MDIKDSYLHGTVGVVKSIDIQADVLKYTLADIANTVKKVTIPVATPNANGLLSKEDKIKLNKDLASKEDITWENLLNKPSDFNPSAHTHSTKDIISLDDYTISTEASDLKATDTLNTALGKLEYKTNLGKTAYDWYKSITSEDDDQIINKWGEIVDFIDSIEEGSDILSKFVTTNTLQTITGEKTFTKALLLSGTTMDTSRIAFSREDYNYITIPEKGSLVIGKDLGSAATWIRITKNGIIPEHTNEISLGSSDHLWNRVYATSFIGNASTATKVGTSGIWLYPEQNNEINFGGTGPSSVIYFGYRSKDDRPIPTQYIFGGSDGSATIKAKTFIGNVTGTAAASLLLHTNNPYSGIGYNMIYTAGQYSKSTTAESGKAFVGSSNIVDAICAPVKDGDESIQNVQNIRLNFNDKYYSELAVMPSHGGIYLRKVINNTAKPWYRLVENRADVTWAINTSGNAETANKLNNDLTIFGKTYNGSEGTAITPVDFVSRLTEGTSNITDGTHIITSYAGDNGFATTNYLNLPYKRTALKFWNYIKSKADVIYAPYFGKWYEITPYIYESSKIYYYYTKVASFTLTGMNYVLRFRIFEDSNYPSYGEYVLRLNYYSGYAKCVTLSQVGGSTRNLTVVVTRETVDSTNTYHVWVYSDIEWSSSIQFSIEKNVNNRTAVYLSDWEQLKTEPSDIIATLTNNGVVRIGSDETVYTNLISTSTQYKNHFTADVFNGALNGPVYATTSLTTAEAIDNFIEAGRVKFATITSDAGYEVLGFDSKDGMIMSHGWYNLIKYGMQLAFDDLAHRIAYRYRSNNNWGSWKKLVFEDRLQDYLPLAGGAMSGKISFPHDSGIYVNQATALLGVGTTSDWAGHPGTGTYNMVGTATYNTIIRSLGTLEHYNATKKARYSILDSGNYTTFINSTNFPGLAGVRSVSLNGNYLKVNTNGKDENLTIPYATNATYLNKRTRLPSSSSNNYQKWNKFGTIDVSSNTYTDCTGFLLLWDCENNSVSGILSLYVRTLDSIETELIKLQWIALNNPDYKDSIAIVKSDNGKFDLYFKTYNNYNNAEVVYIGPRYDKITFVSNSTWVDSITAEATSSLVSFSSDADKLLSNTILTNATYTVSATTWADTGYTFLALNSGTYAIQLKSGNLVASGMFSVVENVSDTIGDEIPLHVYGTASWRPYLRTYNNKLQIASNDASGTSRTVTINIARII